MIVLGKQVGEVWKIPRIPPRASPSEEYSEFPDFSSLFTQDYISLKIPVLMSENSLVVFNAPTAAAVYGHNAGMRIK